MTAGLAAGILTLLLPLAALGKGEVAQPPVMEAPNTTPAVTERPAPQAGGWDDSQTLRILMDDETVETMTMGEYLWRVVAAEMPATFEEEALKAQAVCARTYALWKMGGSSHEGADLCSDSSCCQAYTTHERAAERWGGQNQTYSDKIAAAVSDTDGQLLTYEDKPIQALFFSSSTSSTEDAREVWGSNLPYLVSVASPEGDQVPNYRSTVTVTADELRQKLEESDISADLSGSTAQWFSKVRYTASGRVAELDLGGTTISGGAVRSLLGLRSTCFTVSEGDGVFTFEVVGYGHGVGMSQYGANVMAAEGKNWQEIVRHYYTGVTITQKA